MPEVNDDFDAKSDL